MIMHVKFHLKVIKESGTVSKTPSNHIFSKSLVLPCAFLEQKLYKESILCNQICSIFPGPSYIITRKATNIPKLHPNSELQHT